MANRNKAYIRSNGITYKHIPQAGKTEAILNGCQDNFVDVVGKIVYNNSDTLSFSAWSTSKYDLSNSYRAFAKANTNDGDVYDPETGEQIAYAKVMKKYHKQFDVKLRAFLAEIRGVVAAVEHYMDKKNIDYSEVPNIEQLKVSRFKGKA